MRLQETLKEETAFELLEYNPPFIIGAADGPIAASCRILGWIILLGHFTQIARGDPPRPFPGWSAWPGEEAIHLGTSCSRGLDVQQDRGDRQTSRDQTCTEDDELYGMIGVQDD
jgi:hypothetical protein